jgi:SWI/SNF related-matrix-associated actin-dependent regulator of chromatin subfamily C
MLHKLADNPILSLTAFLASLVPAEVAKAAAKAAIEKISSTKSTSNQKAASPTKQNGSPVEKAAATALGAAAAKASHLSSLEETEMQKATRVTIELQLRKMEMKLSYFQDLEALLESERLELEKARHEFYLARLDFKNGVVKSADAGDGALAVPVESADVEMLKEASMAPLN